MTIKQQGGVFGRNPTFNDVDANSVTADQATINGTVLADEVGINTSPSYPLHVVRDTVGFIAGFRNSDATTLARTIVAGNSLGDLVTAVLANTGNGIIFSDSGKTLALSANGSNTAALTVETSLNVSLRENLVMANGKGIDFSATSGTGTSELFDDYEEGTWTPVVTPLSGAITSYTASGVYTKIGNLVTFGINITVSDNGTGAGYIVATLPFTSAAVSAASGQNANTVNLIGGNIGASATNFIIQKYDGTYPVATGETLRLFGHYQV